MATEAQLAEALRKADAAGDTESARHIADVIRSQRARASQPSQGAWYDRPAPKPRSGWQQLGDSTVNALAGAAQGALAIPDTIQSGGNALMRMGNTITRAPAEYALRAVGANRAAGNVARERDALEAMYAQQGEATAGNAIERTFPTQPGFETSRLISQIVGGMAIPFGPKAAKAAPRLPRPAAQPRVNANPLAPLGRKAVARDAIMRRAGVQNPTTGMVTRDPRLWKFEQDTAKLADTGDDMLAAITGVEDDIRRGARGLVDRQGGAIGQEAMGQRVTRVLSDKNDSLSQEVSALYKTVREQSGNARIPALENLKATYAHPEWADNAQFDDMASAINRRLGRYADADGGASGLTVGQSEELRKFIGNLGSNDRQGFAMRKVFQNALDADVLDNFGGAPFANARAAAAARFAEFGKTLPGKVAAGDIPAERLSTRLMSQATPLNDVRALRTSLTSGRTATQGKEALDSIGAEVMAEMLRKHIPSEGVIKGGSLFKEFQQNAPRLQVILGPERYREMRRLALAARYATADVPKAGVNYSNSATTIASMLGPEVSKSAASNMLPNFARRAAGTLSGALVGNVPGAIIGDQAAAATNRAIAARAARTAGAKVAEQVRLSRDPAAAARLLQSAANDVKADPLVSQFAQKLIENMRNGAPLAARGALPALNRAGEVLMMQAPRRVSAGETPEDQQRQQRGF